MPPKTLKVVSKPLTDLQPDPRNARQHGDRNLAAIKNSLSRFGQRKPIVILDTGEIVAGNGTYTAALDLGWKNIDAVVFDGSADEARAFAIADNRTAELAEWDHSELLETLERFDDELLAAAGWTAEEVGDLGQLWGAPPDLDALADEIGDMTDEDGLIRIAFKVDPDVATMWRDVVKATGIEHMDEAAAAVVRAAHAGISGGA